MGEVMPEISVNQVEYSISPDGPVIHVFGRDKSGEARRLDVTGFKAYFYIPASQANRPIPKSAHIDTETPWVYTSIKGEVVNRVYVDRPSDVRDIRDKFNHLEADVTFTTRFLIDTGIKSGVSVPSFKCDHQVLKPVEIDVPARTCIVDIECDDSTGWPDSTKDPIICITCHDSFKDHYTTFLLWGEMNEPGRIMKKQMSGGLPNGCFNPDKHTIQAYQSEIALMKGFVDYIKETDPDILTGWNFTGFDMPYIFGRLSALGISAESLARLPGKTERDAVRGRQLFDLLAGYKRMHLTEKESYRLDAIAKDEIGEQKLRYSGKLSEVWNLDPVALIEYNFKDVELCVKINAKDETIDFHRELARYVGCPLDKTLNSSTLIDVYILRKAHGKFVLPSKGNVSGEEFEGATVFTPVKGLRENIVVLDLKSLYPMIMMTGNMSPETKDPGGELKTPIGVRFKKQPDGLVRSIQAGFLKERDERKKLRNKYAFGSRDYKLCDMQQNVIKVLMNSYYGVSGYSKFRLYDREIGAAVTSVGREILEHNRKLVEAQGYRVVVGDTDGLGAEIPANLGREETTRIAKNLEKMLNDSYPKFAMDVMNADVSYFSVKFEKLYDRFFSGGKKKRYAGLLTWKEGKDVHEIDIVGFEIRRSDSPAVTRFAQKTLMEMVLNGATYDEIRRVISTIVIKYHAGGYSLDEIGIPGGIQKGLNDYANADAQVRGARYANEYLGANFGKGSKPKRIYLKAVPPGYMKTDVICFEYGDQVPPGFVVDKDVMLEKTIQKPLERIMDALGWNWTDFDPSTPTLSKWGI
jgi:DNA polymerase I